VVLARNDDDDDVCSWCCNSECFHHLIRCVCVWQLINAGITSGAKGALDLWRRQSVTSLESPVAGSTEDVAAADTASPVSTQLCLLHSDIVAL